MKPDREFSDLIGHIYDCALDNSLWPDVLARISEALDGVMADLSVVDPLHGTSRVAAFHNWPQDVLKLSIEHFSITPARGAILTFPLLEPMCTSRHLDIAAFHNSRYWKTCFAGRGYYDYLVTGLTRQVTRLSGWGVLGTEGRGAFDDEDIELARLLSPHIQRASNISGVLDDRRVEAGTLRGAFDALVAAAFIVEPDGRIRFINRVNRSGAGSGDQRMRAIRAGRTATGRGRRDPMQAKCAAAWVMVGTNRQHSQACQPSIRRNPARRARSRRKHRQGGTPGRPWRMGTRGLPPGGGLLLPRLHKPGVVRTHLQGGTQPPPW